MIRKSIKTTKECTFCVHIPKKELKNFPMPVGTGFFISEEGYFITAHHVVKDVIDFSNVRFSQPEGSQVLHISCIKTWEKFDLALLKADYEQNKDREFLNNRTGFPHLDIDFEPQSEGTPIYSYGFPLTKTVGRDLQPIMMMFVSYSPRITSAIISSENDLVRPVRTRKDPKFYAIDKALTFGNSGGPIIITETGKVFAVAIRFQGIPMPQSPGHRIIVPSNYGITTSLSNIKNELKREYGF